MMPMVPMVLWTLQLWVSTLPPIHRSLYLSFSFDLAIFRFLCMILSHPIPLSPSISLYGKPIQYLCEIHEMQIQLNTYIEHGYQRQFDNGFQIYAFLLQFNRWFSSLLCQLRHFGSVRLHGPNGPNGLGWRSWCFFFVWFHGVPVHQRYQSVPTKAMNYEHIFIHFSWYGYIEMWSSYNWTSRKFDYSIYQGLLVKHARFFNE